MTNIRYVAYLSGPIVLPLRGQVEDFDWTNLLEDKTPRGYQVTAFCPSKTKNLLHYLFQVECFVEALRQNLIAVLPLSYLIILSDI